MASFTKKKEDKASSFQDEIESAKWTKKEVDLFVMLMLDEMKKGNRTSSTFKKAGWNNIKTQFGARTGHRYKMSQFRNKMNKLRQDYYNFKKLLETSGFCWDSVTRTITIDDDGIWEKLIKANPSWLKFRKYGLPQWPELKMIFGGRYASGVMALGSGDIALEGGDMALGSGDMALGHAEDAADTNEEVDHDADFMGPNTPLDGGMDDTDGGEPAENPQPAENPKSETRKRDRSPSGISSSRSSEFPMACKAIVEIAQSIMEKFNSTYTVSSLQPAPEQSYSIGNCMDTLNKLTEIGHDVYLKGVKRIMDDPNWREAFMHCPQDKQMWLLDMLD